MSVSSDIMMEFCRLCQSRIGKIPLQYDEELTKKIVEVTRIEVSNELNNYLPMLICISCQEKILDFSNYIQIVQQVDKNLRTAIKKKYFLELEKTCGNIISEDITENTFRCEICLANFADKKLLESHSNTHTKNENVYKCSICLKIFYRERSYNLHKKSHSDLYCSYCSKTFDKEGDHKDHACYKSVKHKAINNTRASLKQDNKGLRKTKRKLKIKTGFLNKFPTLSQEGDTFQCNTCEKKFKEKTNLRHHMRIHRNFTCPEQNCLKELSSAYSFKIHQLNHLGKRPFLCVTCGKSFRTKTSLSCHEKIHSDVKGYICSLCNIGFSVRSNLRAHEKKYHEGIRFYCSQCTKEFLSKSSLERHEKIHIGIKDFKCDRCTSAFYTNKELLKHQRYHQGLKQHKCEECFKTFFERHHLIVHLRSHSGERPYVCNVPGCGKAFAESQKLKRHNTAKHNAIT